MPAVVPIIVTIDTDKMVIRTTGNSVLQSYSSNSMGIG